MGHRPKSTDTTLNVSGETYCKAAGHHPVRREGKIECSTCGISLPDDTPVLTPGRHIYAFREGKLVEVSIEEIRAMKRKKVHSLTKPGPAVTMDAFIGEFEDDALQSRRKLVSKGR